MSRFVPCSGQGGCPYVECSEFLTHKATVINLRRDISHAKDSMPFLGIETSDTAMSFFVRLIGYDEKKKRFSLEK